MSGGWGQGWHASVCAWTLRSALGVESLPQCTQQVLSELPPPPCGQHDASVRLMTGGLACRFRGLLAADNGEQEVESLAEECSEDIKQVSVCCVMQNLLLLEQC